MEISKFSPHNVVLHFIPISLFMSLSPGSFASGDVITAVANDGNSDLTNSTTTTTVVYYDDIPPARLEDFYELVAAASRDNVFVDKTLMIEDFLKGSGRISSVIRPNGWGKTVNLDMLKRFLEIETDPRTGLPLPESDPRSVNYKLFAGGKINRTTGSGETVELELKRLLIADAAPDLMNEHRGRYPVIYLRLGDVAGCSYDQIEERIKTKIIALFQGLRYLRENITNKFDRLDFEAYCDGKFDKPLLLTSLEFLSRILYAHYGQKKAIVLIDDYDYPIRNLFRGLIERRNFSHQLLQNEQRREELFRDVTESEDFFAVFHFFLCFLENSLKSTVRYVHKALLTGMFDVQFSNEFGGLKDVGVYTVQDSGLFDYYGFSQRELNELLQGAVLDRGRKKIDTVQLRNWYGYHFGGRIVYNPYSVRHFLTSGRYRFRPYWSIRDDDASSSSCSLLNYLSQTDQTQRLFQDLLDGRTIRRPVYRTFTFENISKWIFNYLLFSGCLHSVTYGFGERALSVPNKEARSALETEIRSWVRSRFNLTSDDIRAMAATLMNYRVPGFKYKLKPILSRLKASGTQLSETCYDGLMKCVTYAMEENFTLYTNTRTNGSQPNVTLIEKTPKPNKAIFIDYKFVPDPDDAEKEIEVRLQWYDYKIRHTKLQEYTRVPRVLKLVVVFSPKEVRILYQKDKHNLNDKKTTLATYSVKTAYSASS